MFQNCYIRIGRRPVAGCLPLTASLLGSLYALPRAEEADILTILRSLPGAWPWSASLAVAPEQTARAIGAMMRQVMLATARLDPAEICVETLPRGSRAQQHLAALRDLWVARPEVVPTDIATLGAFLGVDPRDAAQSFTLIGDRHAPDLSALERTVLAALVAHHPSAAEDDADYRRLLGERLEPAAPNATLVGHVQRGLTDPGAQPVQVDDSLCVLSVRDSLTEAEAALAIIQRWLREIPGLTMGEIGIIVPQGGSHAAHLAQIAPACGLVLSGVPAVAGARNLGAELVLLFLRALRPPVPAMVLASLHANPLANFGGASAALARRIVAGEGDPYRGIELDRAGLAMRALLALPPPTTNGELAERLHLLMKRVSGGDSLRDERAEARGWIARLLREVPADEAPPAWERLIGLVAPYGNGDGGRGPVFCGGIAVLHDGEAPRRAFRRLLVLGCNDGCYPRAGGGNPLLLDSEVALIAEAIGLRLPSRGQVLERGLALFRRQLCAASERIVLLCSERDGVGKPLAPAAGLALVARLVAGVGKVEELIAPLADGGAAWDALVDWRLRPEFKSAKRVQPPVHYEFGRDLLRIRRDGEGQVRPQSPSRLETLLVSPLAWLLEELGTKPVDWQPEALDVMGRGTLAHGVFEDLFPAGYPVPTAEAAAARVPMLLALRIAGEMPWLAAPEWEVERGALQADIATAARHWARVLADLGAQVVANEFWLEGELDGLEVHGKADCLLLLPDGTLLVVDHKKSGSLGRRRRLKAGADLQVELYRRMQPKVPEGKGDPTGAATLLAEYKGTPAVAYHMMNDGGVLVNGITGTSPHLEEFTEGIADLALTELRARFAALKAGQVHTNARADIKHFEKVAALRIYALERSPLIAAFMRESDQPSAFRQEDE